MESQNPHPLPTTQRVRHPKAKIEFETKFRIQCETNRHETNCSGVIVGGQVRPFVGTTCERLAHPPEKVAFVEGAEEVPFAEVARAIDIMRGAGIDHVGLITAGVNAGRAAL